MNRVVTGSCSTTSISPWRASATVGVLGWALIASGCDSRRVTNNYNPGEPALDGGESPDAAAETAAQSATSEPVPTSSTSSEASDSSEPSALDGGSEPDIEDAGGTASDDAGARDSGVADAGDAGPEFTPENLELDLFGSFHNTFNFHVSDEQLSLMNERYGGGGPIHLIRNQYGDIYVPGGGDGKTYVDELWVTNAQGETAAFGKTEVKLVGESTGRPWSPTSLPNLRVDTNEFTKGHKLGGYENVRFNNAVVGSIFREKFTDDFYRHLGYPAPMAGYGWVQSSVWGEAKVPYVVVEVYKKAFCKDHPEYFGGECPNMWEFPGDFGFGRFSDPDACQFGECDATRVNELDALVVGTPPGPGYKSALADYLDWDAFHEFQCLSWIFVTGDDALHNTNNFVLVERADGKFQYLPYSVDISFGQDWYRYVTLPGQNSVARGCQADPECWQATVATCDVLLDAYEAANPVGRLDALYGELDAAGMLRSGDERRYRDMRAYIEERLANMPGELDAVRENPYAQSCAEGQIMCGNYCAYPQDCYLCNGGGGGVGGNLGKPMPLEEGAAGQANDGAQDVIVLPPPLPVEGDAGVVAPPVEGDGGVEPNPCLPYENIYKVE